MKLSYDLHQNKGPAQALSWWAFADLKKKKTTNGLALEGRKKKEPGYQLFTKQIKQNQNGTAQGLCGYTLASQAW